MPLVQRFKSVTQDEGDVLVRGGGVAVTRHVRDRRHVCGKGGAGRKGALQGAEEVREDGVDVAHRAPYCQRRKVSVEELGVRG